MNADGNRARDERESSGNQLSMPGGKRATNSFVIFLALSVAVTASAPLVFKFLDLAAECPDDSPSFMAVLHQVQHFRGHTMPDPIFNQILAASNSVLCGAYAFFVASVSLMAFRRYAVNKAVPSPLELILLISNGIIIRSLLAYVPYGNFDSTSWEIVSKIVRRGGNIYTETNRYNYTPIWAYILGFFGDIHAHWTSLPFHFLVRSFLGFVDILTLFVVAGIARLEGKSAFPTAIFFFLNPVSFLISGYHGQFENLSILFLLLAIYLSFLLKKRPLLSSSCLWLFSTLAVAIKHNIIYELIVCVKFASKKPVLRMVLLVFSAVLFLSLFAPYWAGGRQAILRHVFLYTSGMGGYGITSLITFLKMQPLFVAAVLLFPFALKVQDIVSQCLICILFFLVFCTGMGEQYFVLPIALGALRPSRGFFIYSLAASLYLLGSVNNVHIPGFSFISLNIVWIGAIYWFATELFEIDFKIKMKHALEPQMKALARRLRSLESSGRV